MVDLVERANEELIRGIDEQRSRHDGRIVITGLISAAAVAASAQALATSAGSETARWAIGTLVCIVLGLSSVTWIQFVCFDIDPARRIRQAEQSGWSDDELLDILVAQRMTSYQENERQLSSRWWTYLHRTASLLGAVCVIWSVLITVGQRAT